MASDSSLVVRLPWLPPAALHCRHCDEPLTPKGDYWTHAHGLYRCQRAVEYGHNAAHPDVPCEPGGPNPCRCTDE